MGWERQEQMGWERQDHMRGEYRKHQRISRTFLLKIFVSNRGCGLSVRTSGHYGINLHKLPVLKELLTSLTLPFLRR